MRKFNNKILIIALLSLLILFVATKLFRSPQRESNLDADVFDLDTARVKSVSLKPGKNAPRLRLVRSEEGWKVSNDSVTAKASAIEVRSLLHALATLEPERVVSRKKEKWIAYEVDDSTGIEVVAYDADHDDLIHLIVGKAQAGSTYIRMAGEDEVYAVSGGPALFKKPFPEWRDPAFLRLQPDLITKIAFVYPADSGFVVERKDNVWMIGQAKADSAAVENYLAGVRSINHSQFKDGFSSAGNPDATVTYFMADDEMRVRAWKVSFFEWVYASDTQPGAWFYDNSKKLHRDLLVGKKRFDLAK